MKLTVHYLLLAVTLVLTPALSAQTPTTDANGRIISEASRRASGETGSSTKLAKTWKTVPWDTVSSNDWMAAVPDASKISSLSIPGTHDSGARVETWPGTAKCQDLSIEDQLYMGVRYLDIRLRAIDDNSLAVHHGDVYQEMNFGDVLKQVTEFLKRNPTEAVLMSVKREKDALNCKNSFAKVFKDYLKNTSLSGGPSYNKSFWTLSEGNPDATQFGTNIPTMGEGIRGKIVLIRRFNESGEKIGGIDAVGWPDNQVGCVEAGPYVWVQDEYSLDYFGGLSKKLSRFEDTMNLAYNNRDKGILYLNYSSGVSKGIVSSFGLITYVSSFMNPKLDGRNGLLNAKSAPYGVIAMDFVNKSRADYAWKSNVRGATPGK